MNAEATPSDGNQWNLFGFDLREAWGAYLSGWREALARPWLSWMAPDEQVRLLRADGSVEFRLGSRGAPLAEAAAQAHALELPEDLALENRRVLPALPTRDLERALALQVSTLSPFAEADTVWGWRSDRRADGQLDVRIVIASRSQVLAHLERQGGAAPTMEVWYDAAQPVVLGGFGEAARLRRRARRGVRSAILFVLAIALLLALSALPVVWEHQRAAQARVAYDELQRQAEPLMARKEQLVQLTEGLASLDARIQAYVSPLPVLARLTEAVPDTAMVDRLTLEQGKLRIWGQAADAAALLAQVGQGGGFHNVRSPSAIQRNARTGKESYAIEMDLRAEGGGS